MCRIILATHNKNKVNEMRYALKDLNHQIVTLDELGITHDVEEPYETLEENSFEKALDASKYISSGIIVSEDSGFYVEAMGGKPGVYSARYLKCLSEEDRNKAILEQVDAINRCNLKNNRNCYYAGVMTVLHKAEDGMCYSVQVRESCSGQLSYSVRGLHGFAYDSIIIPNGTNKTLAEMIPEEQTNYKHRYKLMKTLKDIISNLGKWGLE